MNFLFSIVYISKIKYIIYHRSSTWKCKKKTKTKLPPNFKFSSTKLKTARGFSGRCKFSNEHVFTFLLRTVLTWENTGHPHVPFPSLPAAGEERWSLYHKSHGKLRARRSGLKLFPFHLCLSPGAVALRVPFACWSVDPSPRFVVLGWCLRKILKACWWNLVFAILT